MCFGGGGGKTTEEFYEEMRVEPEPLPSLGMTNRTKRSGAQYKDYKPSKVRSLLQPMVGGNG